VQKIAAESAQMRSRLEYLDKEVRMLSTKLEDSGATCRQRVNRKGVKGRGGQSRMSYRPTLEIAERQPTHVCELGHQTLAQLAILGSHPARRERLLREIMCVEGVSWGEAHKTLVKIDEHIERCYWLESLPYRVGITLAVLGAFAGVLLVFCKPIAYSYGTQVAGEELPEGVEDISELTVNQVGTWTWSWMEPMIGVASFVLLCCQFTRAQATKMNMKTYAEVLLAWRADRAAKKFPNYDRSMVRSWAKHMPRVGLNFFPIYERDAGFKGPTSGL